MRTSNPSRSHDRVRFAAGAADASYRYRRWLALVVGAIRLLPLELRNEGTPGRPRRRVLPKDHAHRHGHGARNTFDAYFDQRSTVKIRLHHVQGHVPPSQAGLEERVLCSQVRKAPGKSGQHAEITAITERGAVREDQLYVLA